MNFKLIILFGALTAIVLGCSNNSTNDQEHASNNAPNQPTSTISGSEKEYPKKKMYTLLLIDKTTSSEIRALETKYKDRISELVKGNFNYFGSVFQGSFIHGNTLGVPPFVVQEFDLEPLGSLEKLPKIEKVQTEKKHKTKEQNEQTELIEIIESNLSLSLDESTKKYTDLWGTLELMSSFFQKFKDNSPKEVIFISDMMESMPGKGRRNFHQKLPSNKEEAEQLARKDAQWIQQNFSINIGALKDVHAIVWPPIEPLAASHFRVLRYYWEALFKEFGMQASFF